VVDILRCGLVCDACRLHVSNMIIEALETGMVERAPAPASAAL
jgi:hypothetical protein